MNIDLSTIKKICFIGIGGVGISALARLALYQKKTIVGINDNPSPQTLDFFRERGIQILVDKNPAELPEADLYVYSDAWLHHGADILKRSKDTGKPVLSYAQALGIFTQGYKVVAISGTHGKTTTTAMIAHILKKGDRHPTVIVGSLMQEEKSNFLAGDSEYFIVEADEYMRHFLNLNPYIWIITNIEADHLDYYKDLNDIKDAFYELAMKVPADGYIVCNQGDPIVQEVVSGVHAKVVDYRDFYHRRDLRIPGSHNQANAAAAAAAVSLVGVNNELADMYLKTFPGTWRRFEYKGELTSGTPIYDDYAHHPTEVAATLQAFREIYPFGQKRITVVFQPHLYSRTKLLLGDFGKAFGQADRVIVLPIYAAREENDGTISSEMVVEKIQSHKISAQAASSFDVAIEMLRTSHLGPDDVLVTMGAGEAYKIGDNLLKSQ